MLGGKDVPVDADEEEIRKLVGTWMNATKAGDIDTVLGLMTDDVVFLVAGRPPMIGKETFAALARGQEGQSPPEYEGRSEIQEIHVVGDIAYMWTKLTVSVTPPGESKPITRAGCTLTVLRRQDGRWLLARDANMLTVVEDELRR
jgi:uncharacterized protein (TIGR02246 family)